MGREGEGEGEGEGGVALVDKRSLRARTLGLREGVSLRGRMPRRRICEEGESSCILAITTDIPLLISF